MTAESLDLYRSAGLAEVDPEIASLIERELESFLAHYTQTRVDGLP